jgi:hypothetical protein
MALLHLGIRFQAKLGHAPGTGLLANTTGLLAQTSSLIHHYDAIAFPLLNGVYGTNR